MKKMKKFSILFIAFLMLFSANIFAVDYDLWVAGVQVNTLNKDDISVAVVAAGQSASGTITYNTTTNTLTLNNATLNTTSHTVLGIKNKIPNLTINLIGENTITANAAGIYSFQADLTITGSGSLTINSYYGISHNKCSLTIENTTVTAVGESRGINGYNTNNGFLSITNSTVRATGTNQGSIRGMSNLVLNGCAITQPTGAVFDAEQHAVYHNGTLVKTEVVIEPPVSYNLYLADLQVTNLNKGNITSAIVAAGKDASGTITYDPTSKTLTLEDATINVTGGINGIKNEIYGLTINLIGENTITSTGSVAINLLANTNIIGAGWLTVTGSQGIYHNNCDLTIENTTVTATGSAYGISGNNNSEILSITNSTVRAKGTSSGSIARINNLVLNGCGIFQPTGAVFNASQNAVCYDYGDIVKGYEVVIEPGNVPTYYDLWVAGVQVTSINKDDITAAVVAAGKNASGTISYDPIAKILTLVEASISLTGGIPIRNDIPNLRIALMGDNYLATPSYAIYSNEANLIISGTGSLISSSLVIESNIGICHSECNLTIENTTVTIDGTNFGIKGNNGDNEVLTIKNSTVRSKGIDYGSITKIKNLVLNGCAILQPEGAVFFSTQKAVCLNGAVVKGHEEVVIAPIVYDLQVAGVQVTSANENDITSVIAATGQSVFGTITYDQITNTLTLEDASITIDDEEIYGIYSEIPDLTIELIGENHITAGYHGLVFVNGDAKITGNGSLTVMTTTSSLMGYAIRYSNCNLTIENTTVTATGTKCGIDSMFGDETLSITNSTVKATGAEYGSIRGMSNLVLNGCAISQPVGAVFDASSYPRGVYCGGEIVKTEVLIEPTVIFTEYDLYVNEIQVTSNNATDILGNGTVTYDPTNNKLTLNNATITCNNQGIVSQIENLTINLIGQNTITSEYCILIEKNTTITGTGSLYATTTINGIGIYQNNCNLTIDNTTVTVIGDFFGICGDNGNNEVLSINNSTVKVRGTYGGSIIDINNLVLNGCAITQPAGAIFDASQHAVSLNGEIVKTEIVITPTIPVAIEENINENIIFQVNGKELTIVNTENLPIRIYNLVGQEIAYKENSNNQESFNLPQTGVYIVKIGNKSEKIFIK